MRKSFAIQYEMWIAKTKMGLMLNMEWRLYAPKIPHNKDSVIGSRTVAEGTAYFRTRVQRDRRLKYATTVSDPRG